MSVIFFRIFFINVERIMPTNVNSSNVAKLHQWDLEGLIVTNNCYETIFFNYTEMFILMNNEDL